LRLRQRLFSAAANAAALLLLTSSGIAATPDALPEQLRGLARSTLEIRSSQGRQWFNIYLASTEAQQMRGLMYVRQLQEDAGVLFPLATPRPMTMWMKNTLIPLDMLFIDNKGRIVCLRERTVPQSLELLDCPVAVKAVLEISGGQAAKRGIKLGDSVVHRSLNQ
jgi:uncharacterized membrane protein (UPF0127 family)